MTDIWVRLKDWEHIYEEERNGDDGDLYLAAADEIERLRDIADELATALAALLDTSAEGGDDLSEVTRQVFEADRKARAALAEYREET